LRLDSLLRHVVDGEERSKSRGRGGDEGADFEVRHCWFLLWVVLLWMLSIRTEKNVIVYLVVCTDVSMSIALLDKRRT